MGYYDEVPGEPQQRSFNGKKLLAALAVWAIQLTPGLSLVISRDVLTELDIDRETVKMIFKFIGCSVQASGSGDTKVKLESAPRFNASNYHSGIVRKKPRGGGK